MSIKGSLLFYFISAILAILFINLHNYLILGIFFILLIFVSKRLSYKYGIIMIIIFAFFSFYRINKIPNINLTYTSLEAKVIEKKEKYVIVKNDNVNYLIYTTDNIIENDIILVKGEISPIEKDLDLYLFEFKDYLENKRVFYQINSKDITLLKRNEKISTRIINSLTNKLEGSSLKMVKMLLFNDKKINEEAYNNLININALHLFVVSGFHINFFYLLICFLFKKTGKFKDYISFIILLFYVYLLDFSISASKALIVLAINKSFKDTFNKYDAISIAGFIFLLIEPLNVFNYSFIMTYVISFTIEITNNITKNENKISKVIISSFTCLLALLPIQLLINYKINFISFFTNILLNKVVMVIFVLSLFSIILSFFNFDKLSIIYDYFFKLIEKINNVSYPLIFGNLKPWMIVVYYILFISLLLFLEQKSIKKFLLSFILLIISLTTLYFKNYLINYQQVTFLNVYQGNCSIIIDSNNKGVTLIDTGGILNYDIANKKIIPYLQYLGIKQIDNIFISHDDYDHNGALTTLQENFIVKNVIKDNNFEKIKLGNIEFYNLNSNANYNLDNENSMVIYANICNQDILFMGDAPIKIEKKIMKEYGYFNVDILLVGHHGSSTSTSKEFVNFYQPDIAIISVGKNNKYGHPNKEVLEILKDVKVYRTDINGSIKIDYNFFDKYFLITAK